MRNSELHLPSLCFVLVIGLNLPTAFGQPCADGEWCQWPVEEKGNGHWYRLTGTVLSWQEAEDAAVSLGGHLVTINDADENAWLTEKFPRPVSSDPNFFIGFYQDTSDSNYLEPNDGWKWIGDLDLCAWQTGNPEVCYTNWHSGEPNNTMSGEDYAVLHWSGGDGQGLWNDASGLGPGPGIVEVEELTCVADPSCCPADLDCDGDVGAADLAILLASWGECMGDE